MFTRDTHLQEELEAYDKHQRLLEDQLDGKTAELIGGCNWGVTQGLHSGVTWVSLECDLWAPQCGWMLEGLLDGKTAKPISPHHHPHPRKHARPCTQRS